MRLWHVKLFGQPIEPGFYEDGEFGIRIENVVIVKNADTKVERELVHDHLRHDVLVLPQYNFGGGGYLTFEPITLVSTLCTAVTHTCSHVGPHSKQDDTA